MRVSQLRNLDIFHFPASILPSPAPITPPTHSRYLKTSPLPVPPFRSLPNAFLPTNPPKACSTSRVLNERCPGSGAVCKTASRSSLTSISPPSRSSNAANAFRSSSWEDKGARREEKFERYVGRARVSVWILGLALIFKKSS